MGNLKSQALEALRENGAAQCGPALRSWKDSGGKVMGLMYAYVPEEIFAAAGMLPYRLRAFDNDSMALANARFQDISCTLVRRFYDEIKRGGFDFCDGFVSANACDHERRLLENVTATCDVPYAHLVNFPKKVGDEQVDFYEQGLRKLVSSMEEHFDIRITEERLRQAIVDYNHARALQRSLYELRKRENPPLSGADMLAVMMARTSMPIGRYIELLEQLLADAREAPGIEGYTMRAFLYAGEIDSIALVEAIESQGVLVVGDYMGYGYRACRNDVPNTGDALRDLATHMVKLCPDPRQWGTMDVRQPLVAQLVREFDADGVIFPAIAFCDHWTWEQYNFEMYAKQAGIPVLNLELEYLFNSAGQTKTRVQAFAEAHGRN